jgi:hypothetical protein
MATNNPTDSAPISGDQYVDSVDFRVRSITHISADGRSRDITNLTLEIQIRQDLFLGFMSGEMLVADGIDLHSRSAMHGNEYIFLHLTEPEQSVSIRKAFRIYKLANRHPTTSGGQRYVIYFASPEMFTSNQKKISRAYKSSTVSEVAQDIMVNYLDIDSNRIRVDDSLDASDIIVPSKRPAEALNWLASRAYGQDATCWFFYENLDGFNFRSLQSIYKEGTKIKVPFTFENKTGMKQLEMDKYTIDDIDGKTDFDSLSTLTHGGTALSLLGIDPIARSHVRNDYGVDQLPTLYPAPAMSNPDNLFAQTDAYQLAYLQMDGTRSDEWVKRVMTLATLNNSLMELVVPGNMRLQVGTLVNLRIPYATTPSEGDIWDKRKSGKYLVVAVNQKFDLSNHRFNTIILLSRDSMPEALPVADGQLPKKIRKMNTNSNRD